MGVTSSLRGEKSTSEQHFRQGLELAKRHRCCGIVGANCELGLASLLLGGGPPTGLGKPGGTGETSGLPLPPNQEEEALELLRSVRVPFFYPLVLDHQLVYTCLWFPLLHVMTVAVQFYYYFIYRTHY